MERRMPWCLSGSGVCRRRNASNRGKEEKLSGRLNVHRYCGGRYGGCVVKGIVFEFGVPMTTALSMFVNAKNWAWCVV
eukprot:scaffold13773_cov71-Cylindrotheca_fusiformis.AAC.1